MSKDLPPQYNFEDEEPELPKAMKAELDAMRAKSSQYLDLRHPAGNVTGVGSEMDPYNAQSGDLQSIMERVLDEHKESFFYFQFNSYKFMINLDDALFVNCITPLRHPSEIEDVEMYKNAILKAIQAKRR